MGRAKNYSHWSHCNGTVLAVFPSNYFDFSCGSARISEQPGDGRRSSTLGYTVGWG